MYVNQTQAEVVLGSCGSCGQLGALKAYDAVKKLQRFLDDWAPRADFDTVDADGKYGGCTHAALKLFAEWYSEQPGVTLSYSDTAIDVGGPMAAAAFLAAPYQSSVLGHELTHASSSFTAAELTQLQTAYGEWLKAGKAVCGSTSGGGGGAGTHLPDGSILTTDIEPSFQQAGLGTAGWALVGVAALAGAYALYKAYSKKGHGRR